MDKVLSIGIRPRVWQIALSRLGEVWPRVFPLVLLGFAGLVIFVGFRAGLLYSHRGAYSDMSPDVITQCLMVGLRYDAVPLGYILAPLALAMMLVPDRFLGYRWFQRSITIYVTAGICGIALVEVIGLLFFLHFALRLNLAVFYLENSQEIVSMLWRDYPILPVAAGLVVASTGSYLGLRRIILRRHRVGGSLRVRAAFAFGIACVLVMACRGGLANSLDERAARFSDNNVLTELTLNDFFTLSHAVSEAQDPRNELVLYNFTNAQDSTKVTRRMLHQPQDVLLGFERNPIWRRTNAPGPRRDYNVVLILMEGMAGKRVGCLGNSPSYTPFVDSIVQEGIWFDRMYAVGPRTNRGVLGVTCGHPDVGGLGVLKSPQAHNRFFTLPSLLRQRGYRTTFFYGGNPTFDNMKDFFAGKGGIDEVIWQKHFDRQGVPSRVWGSPDEVVLNDAHERFQTMGDKPFFSLILTTSNHEPFDLPTDSIKLLPAEDEENRITNGYIYSDWALSQFFEKARKAAYFKNTIFILVADHGKYPDPRHAIDVPGFHVPCVFYAPSILPRQKVSTVCSQVDIAPTLMGLLGGSFEHCFMGRDVLGLKPEEGFAVMHRESTLAIVEGQTALIQPARDLPRLASLANGELTLIRESDPKQVRRLQRRLLSYYWTGLNLFLDREYRDPSR